MIDGITKEQYVKDLKMLHLAQHHITKLFGEEAGIDYVISECKKYTEDGEFSEHCREYAEKAKDASSLTEAEINALLPETWDGKKIWGHQDLS